MGRSRADVLFARFRRTGDPRALAQLFDLTAPELLRVAVYLAGDRNLAEDLVQATFLAAIEGQAGFTEGKAVLPWLLAILANRARLARRETARRADPARLQTPPIGDPAAEAERAEFAESLDRALRELQEPYRQVLLLHLQHGLSAREIAETLARPGGTVRTQLVRGMELLRGALPAGFVAGALVVATPGHGLAAVKAAVLESVGATVPAATSSFFGGILLMKKSLAIVAAALLACAGVLFELGRETSEPAKGIDPVASLVAAKDAQGTLSPADARGRADEVPTARPGSDRVALAEPLAPGTGGLRVRVLWGDDHSPADGVVVFALPARSAPDHEVGVVRSRSSARGEARFADLVPGAFVVEGDRGGKVRVAVRPGEWAEAALEIPAGVSVAGSVVDAKQKPVAGARVCVSAPSPAPARAAEAGSASSAESFPDRSAELTRGFELATTDAAGRFLVRSLEPGRSLIAVAAGEIRSRWKRIPKESAGVQEVILQLGGKGSSVSGVVQGPEGKPVSGAHVLVDDHHEVTRSVRTDERGEFLAEGIMPGSWVPVRVRASGFFLWKEVLLVRESRASRVTARLRIGASVKGQIRNGAGAPVSGARISTFQDEDGGGPELQSLTRTDAEGRFAARSFYPGRLKLQAQAGDQWVIGSLDLVDGRESTWNGVLGYGASIQGTVVDAKGAPLANWQVSADGGRGVRRCMGVATDALGSFRIDGCEDAAYEVSVRAKDVPMNRPAAKVDEARPGGAPVRIVVPEERLPSSWVTGTLLDSEGKPVTGGSAYLSLGRVREDGSREYAGGMTWDRGRFRLGPVMPGTWSAEIVLEDSGCSIPLGPRKLEAGQTCDLGTVRAARPGFVRLQVRDAEGEPLERATFAAFRGDRFMGEIYVLAGSGGSGRSSGLRPGTYRICTYDVDRLPKWSREAEVRSDEETLVEATLPRAVVRLVNSPAMKSKETWIVETWRRQSGEVLHVLERGSGTRSYLREERFIPGTYEVEIKDQLGHIGKATFVIDDDASSDQVLELPCPPEVRR